MNAMMNVKFSVIAGVTIQIIVFGCRAIYFGRYTEKFGIA